MNFSTVELFPKLEAVLYDLSHKNLQNNRLDQQQAHFSINNYQLNDMFHVD